MTVEELREMLLSFPQDLPVMIEGQDGGLEDLDGVLLGVVTVAKDVYRSPRNGPHKPLDDPRDNPRDPQFDTYDIVPALRLARRRHGRPVDYGDGARWSGGRW